MKRDRLNTELQALERRIRMLLSELNSLNNDLSSLKNENLELRSVINAKDAQIADFQNKNNISTIVDGISTGDVQVSEVKEKLNDYIKEIDKCIKYLNH
ncbi:MAG: hypothetical protein ACFCUU_03365 [Cyclobacteriaceae bacterium]